MKAEGEGPENLFSYGTLRDESVQLATFGRRLAGRPDVLVGYRLQIIRIKDEEFVALSGSARHRSLLFTGLASDTVGGTVLMLSGAELARADAYEPACYERKLVRLKSGTIAWVYVNAG